MNEPHPLHFSVHSRLRLSQLGRLLPDGKGKTFLDVGCGLGYMLETLAKEYTSKIGLDYELASLVENKKRIDALMVRGSAYDLPFAEGSVDTILATEMLEHLPDGDDEKALCDMARIVKPGGRILITVPALEGVRSRTALRNFGHDDPEGGEYHYRMGYYAADLHAMVERIPGLRVERTRFSMFLISELFMDLLKVVYSKKSALKEHSDIMKANDSLLFRVYRKVFPFLNFLFQLEDRLLCPLFKGHILILSLKKE